MSGYFFRSPRSLDFECIDGWYRCLRCFRFFTKKVDELYCHDCCTEIPDDCIPLPSARLADQRK